MLCKRSKMLYSREVIYFSKVRHREALLRLLTVGLLLYMLIGFGTSRLRLNMAAGRERELDLACASLREENEALRRSIASQWEDETAEAMARDRLGLVMPGERIYYFN